VSRDQLIGLKTICRFHPEECSQKPPSFDSSNFMTFAPLVRDEKI
jgi:hypothetical protein